MFEERGFDPRVHCGSVVDFSDVIEGVGPEAIRSLFGFCVHEIHVQECFATSGPIAAVLFYFLLVWCLCEVGLLIVVLVWVEIVSKLFWMGFQRILFLVSCACW